MAEIVHFENYRRTLPAAAPPAAAAPPRVGMPLAPGTVLVAKGNLTTAEYNAMKRLGLADGDPVPANLADLLAAEAASHAAAAVPKPGELPQGYSADSPPVVVPSETPIDLLSEARRREIVEAVRLGQSQEAAILASRIEGAGPGVNEALAFAAGAAPSAPVAAPMGSIVGTVARGDHVPTSIDLTPRVQPAPAQAAPPPAPAAAVDSGAVMPANCPHCGWDRTRPDPTEPTESDKDRWRAMILGGKDARFSKQYGLYSKGGVAAVTVEFRTLTARESDALFQQMGREVRNGLSGTGEYLLQRDRYTMAASIATARVGETLYRSPCLDEPGWLAVEKEPDGAQLPPRPVQLREFWYDAALVHAALIHGVEDLFHRFRALCDKLTFAADNPDFF